MESKIMCLVLGRLKPRYNKVYMYSDILCKPFLKQKYITTAKTYVLGHVTNSAQAAKVTAEWKDSAMTIDIIQSGSDGYECCGILLMLSG